MWLYVPSTPSPSVAEVEASTSGSSSPPAEPLMLWLSLSGKPTRRPVSWRGWLKRPWLRLLSPGGFNAWSERNVSDCLCLLWARVDAEVARASRLKTRSPEYLSRVQTAEGPRGATPEPGPTQPEVEGVSREGSTEGDRRLRREVCVLWRGAAGVLGSRSREWRGNQTAEERVQHVGVNLPICNSEQLPRDVQVALSQLQLVARVLWLLPARERARCESLASALAVEGLTLACDRPCPMHGRFATSSERHSQQPVSLQECTSVGSTKPQSGTTSPPSTVARGVASWIASLAEHRVRTSASQSRSAEVSTASALDSSTSRSASLVNASRRSSSGKTSPEQLALCLPSSPSSRRAATPARPSAFELLTWEPPTFVDGSSFSLTCAAFDSPSLWATPSASLQNYLESPASFDARSSRLVAKGSRPLGINLGQQAKRWPTPAARDAKGKNGPEHLAKARGHHDQLPNAVALWSGRRALMTSTPGSASSPSAPTSRLNPAFVEWLMGWPESWSLPGLTAFDSSGTASSRRRPPPRSRSSGNTSKRGKVVDGTSK